MSLDDTEALRARVAELEARVESHPATASEASKLRGWKEIADYLHADVRSAQRWATRQADPLPVAHDHLGVVAVRSALDRWRWDQLVPYRVHVERVRARVVSRRGAPKRGQP